MLDWLKNVWTRYKVHVTVVGGALVVATVYGTCTFEPAVSINEETEVTTEVIPAGMTTETTGNSENTENTETTETTEATETTEEVSGDATTN